MLYFGALPTSSSRYHWVRTPGLVPFDVKSLRTFKHRNCPGVFAQKVKRLPGPPPSHCCSKPVFNIQALPRHASSPVPSPLGLSKSICLTSLVLDIPRLPPQRVRPSLDCPPYARTHMELSHLWGLCPLGRSPNVPNRGWHPCSFTELVSPEFLFPRRTFCAWASTAPVAAAQGPWPPPRTAHRRETPGLFPRHFPKFQLFPLGLYLLSMHSHWG
jgi:hypothetical protein